MPGVKEATGTVVIIAKHLCGVASDLAIHSTKDPALRLEERDNKVREVGLCIATCCHHACSWPDYAGKEWLLKAGFTKEEFNLLKHWSGWSTGLQALWSGVNSTKRGGPIRNHKDEDSAGLLRKRQRIGLEQTEGDDEDEDETLETQENNEHGPAPRGDFPRPSNITTQAMARAGYITKRVLDQGRCEALQAAGLRARQVQYCAPHESPECFVIVACPATNITNSSCISKCTHVGKKYSNVSDKLSS